MSNPYMKIFKTAENYKRKQINKMIKKNPKVQLLMEIVGEDFNTVKIDLGHGSGKTYFIGEYIAKNLEKNIVAIVDSKASKERVEINIKSKIDSTVIPTNIVIKSTAEVLIGELNGLIETKPEVMLIDEYSVGGKELLDYLISKYKIGIETIVCCLG